MRKILYCCLVILPFLQITGTPKLGQYGTHQPALIKAVNNTKGPVLEMGCGNHSTPLLHDLCSKENRYLLSTDTDKKWLDKFLHLKCDLHEFLYVPVYDDDWALNPKPYLWDEVGNNVYWSVVLIDHRPGERRKDDIERLRYHTEIFVVHDTETASYGYEKVLSTFKYRYDYKIYNPNTTLVSDTIDVRKLFE